MLLRHFLWIVLLWIVTAAGAQEVPYFSGYVVDQANLLNEETIQELTARLEDHNQRTTNQVAVLTIPTLEGGDIDDFATRTYETWDLGSGEKTNGALLVIAPRDRKMVIRTGYDLEPYLTDAYANRIIQEVIAPQFRKDNFDAGVKAGVNAILEKVEGIDELSEREVVQQDEGFGFGAILLGLFSAIAGFFIIKKRRRNAPRKSKKTGLPMKKLSEKEEDGHLSRGQQVEEEIGSVDYDVWVSDKPDDVMTLAYRSTLSKYSECPNCGFRTYYHANSKTLRSATYGHNGEGVRNYACRHCDYTHTKRYRIPRLQRRRTVIVGGGGFIGGGGGFSGGGSSFGGGGFSGGGFSGGGFGTGGGGASGGW